MTIDNSAILAELQAQYAADKPAAHAHYAQRLIERLYKKREVQEAPFEALLTARIEIQSVNTGPVSIEAIVREDEAYRYVSAADIRSQDKLALTMLSSQALNFKRGAGDNFVEITGPNLPASGITVGMYVKAKVRGGFPKTKGVQIIAKTGEGDKCRVEAKVSERAISIGRTGGTFAKGSVEWITMGGTAAAIARVTGEATGTIERAGAGFDTKVEVGDILRAIARTGSNPTIDPAFIGYYVVDDVSEDALTVNATQRTRTSEGVYAPASTLMPEFEDVVDFQVLRTRQNITYLRDTDESFAGVGADDWIRATTTPRKVFKVEERLSSGLLLLEDKQYTNNQAPYSFVANITSAFGTNTWDYGIYRAPLGKMAIFRITDNDADFSYVKVGDMVELSERSGLLDPTVDDDAVEGIYRVASVPSPTVINLENTRFERQGNLFVADDTLYASFLDNASYETYRFAQAFPAAALYKVTAVNSGSIRLDHHVFNGYSGYAGNFTQGDAIDVFDDVMDADWLKVYNDVLAIVAPSQNFDTKILPGDYVSLVRRTVPPATARSNTNGTFRVASSPRRDVLFLERQRLRGDFEDVGGRRAPYLAYGDELDGEWSDSCDFTSVRVFPGQYKHALATGAGFFADAMPGDFVEVTTGPLQARGAWLVDQRVGNDQVQLRKDILYTRIADRFEPAILTVSSFRQTLPVTLARYTDHVTEMHLYREEGWADVVSWLTLDANKDVFKFTYDGQERLFAAEAVDGVLLYLTARYVTGTNGIYAIGSTKATAHAITLVQVTRIRPVEDLAVTLAYLDLFRTQILPNEKRQLLDKMVAAIVPDLLADRYSDTMLSAARMAADQASYVSDAPVSFKGTPSTPSATRDGLPPFEFQPDAFLLAQDAFQRAVAVAVAVDFQQGYAGKTFAELKDIYVDAKLREDGFTALATYASGAGIPATSRKQELALAAVGKMFASKNQDAVEGALRQRNRADLVLSFNNQLTNQKAIVATLLPVGFINPDRMYVKDDPMPIADSPLFYIPFTTLGRIKNASARERRDAIKGMISVPADRTLRAKRRSYALRKNHANHCGQSAEDAARHLEVATDPGIIDALGAAVARFTNCNLAEGALADELGEELDLQDSERPEVYPPVDPNNQGAFSASYASIDTPPAAQMQLVVKSTPAIPFAATATQATAADAAGGDSIIVPSVRDGNITNLFDNDIQDFRHTGIILPLDFLDQDPGKNNRERLASIFMVDRNGTPVGGFSMKAAGRPRANVYNHFILQKWDETHVEKVQLQDTLGDGFVLNTFGSQPEVWSMSGVLLNDVLSDQVTRFRDLWESDLRASKLAKNGYKMVINVPAAGIIVMGYGINLQISVSSESNEALVPFAMQFVVARWYPLPLINFIDSQKMAIARKITEMSGGRVFSRLRTGTSTEAPTLQTPRQSNVIDGAKAKAAEAVSSLLNPGLREAVSGLGISFFG